MKLNIPCILISFALFAPVAESATIVPIQDNNISTYVNQNHHTLIGNEGPYTYKPSQKITLRNGLIKIKYTQYYLGVPVYNGLLSATEANGRQKDWYGQILMHIEEDLPTVKPSFNAAQALAIAKDHFKIQADDHLHHEKTELYIWQNQQNHAELVYLVSFNIEGKGRLHRPFYMINAHTGKVLRFWDGLNTRAARGPGGNLKTGRYFFNADLPGNFGFLEVSKTCSMSNDMVDTYDMGHSYDSSSAQIFSFPCPRNVYQEINGAYSPLNDAHYFATQVFKMYSEWYGYTLPLPQKLKVYVHYGRSEEQAYWNGSALFIGDGNLSTYPLTAIDVIAHELGHAIISGTSRLEYIGQSGAINEAFADIAGETAEAYLNHQINKSNDWMVGASILKEAGKAMRYFINPHEDGVSIEHFKDYQQSLPPHHASGLFNKAFYTLATKEHWNIRKAFSVYLVANLHWLPAETFEHAACGVLKAARDFRWNEDDVIASFATVGIAIDALKCHLS